MLGAHTYHFIPFSCHSGMIIVLYGTCFIAGTWAGKMSGALDLTDQEQSGPLSKSQ
jgi:hypothetical protein